MVRVPQYLAEWASLELVRTNCHIVKPGILYELLTIENIYGTASPAGKQVVRLYISYNPTVTDQRR
jgi:hypothetical protein